MDFQQMFQSCGTRALEQAAAMCQRHFMFNNVHANEYVSLNDGGRTLDRLYAVKYNSKSGHSLLHS